MLILSNRRHRILFKLLLLFLFIPAAVFFGSRGELRQRYLLVSLLVAFLSLLLFYTGFEQKKIGTRRMVLVSVLLAISVMGRLIPFFKPVTAITVLAAVYFGGEAGFLVGSLSALLSGFYAGQGPWTPFQMLAWGLIGFCAGLLARPLQKSRWLLLLYGALSGIFFSLVMDVWMVLWYNGELSPSLYSAALINAVPHTLLYAISNVVFLFFLGEPFGKKLGRIKCKYGI